MCVLKPPFGPRTKKPAGSSRRLALCSLYHLSKGLWIHLRLVVTLEMPSKDSSYRKVFFTEHMPIERTPKSRALAVIIEILEPAKKNRVDVRDAAMIKFASDLVQKRIMNEGWGPTEKRVETILFNQLPPLGEPVRKGDDFIAWIVE